MDDDEFKERLLSTLDRIADGLDSIRHLGDAIEGIYDTRRDPHFFHEFQELHKMTSAIHAVAAAIEVKGV